MKSHISKNNYAIISGILLLIKSIYGIININIEYVGMIRLFTNWIYNLSFLLLGIMLIKKVKHKILLLPICGIVFVNIFWIILNLLSIDIFYYVWVINFAGILFGVIAILMLAKLLLCPKKAYQYRDIWFIPALLEFLSYLCEVILVNIILDYGFDIHSLILSLTLCAAYAFAGLYFAKDIDDNAPCDNKTDINISSDDGHCDMTKHVLLLIFTGFIWYYIWIYRTTKYLNTVPGYEKRDPVTKLLLCMFIPFYNIYWVYQSAKRVDSMAKLKNTDSDITTVSTVLAVFIGIVPPIIMQNKINQLCKNHFHAPTEFSQPSESHFDAAAEIRKYKQLLDDGIISQSEFDAKKKQLLGL